MKRYIVIMKLWTGSTYENGEKEYDKSITVKTDDVKYLWKRQEEVFSEIDIATDKVHWFDINGDRIDKNGVLMGTYYGYVKKREEQECYVMENKNVFNFGIPGLGAELAALTFDKKVIVLEALVEKAEKLKDEIEETDLELHAIDNVLSKHRDGGNEEEKQKLNDRADELMKRKEIIWPEFFSVGDTMVNIFRAITAEFPQGRIGPVVRCDKKAAKTAIDEKQPGLSERYKVIVDFFEELIRL